MAEHLLPPRVGGAIAIRSAPVDCDRDLFPVLHNIHVGPGAARDLERARERQVQCIVANATATDEYLRAMLEVRGDPRLYFLQPWFSSEIGWNDGRVREYGPV